ncbi:MAG: hypothetical protein JSV12_07575, partial [Candidatus Bathyarchaeota archaeon]
MKKNLLRICLIVLLIISVFSALSVSTIKVSAVDYPGIYIEPANITNLGLTPGDTFTISVKTNYTGSDVYSYQFNLNFDAGILHGGLNKTDIWAGDGTTTYTTTEYPVYPPEKISVNGSSMRKVTD